MAHNGPIGRSPAMARTAAVAVQSLESGSVRCEPDGQGADDADADGHRREPVGRSDVKGQVGPLSESYTWHYGSQSDSRQHLWAKNWTTYRFSASQLSSACGPPPVPACWRTKRSAGLSAAWAQFWIHQVLGGGPLDTPGKREHVDLTSIVVRPPKALKSLRE
jgi:hypothetical protein